MEVLERSLLEWIQTHLRCEILDALMPVVSRICDHGEVWILLAVILVMVRRYRQSGAAVGCALVMELVACNLILKPLVGRLRPFAVDAAVELLIAPPADASFPSGHTAASFAAVFALKASGCWLWKPGLVLAAAIAFSRLYLYVHWPSDVLAGALLGAAVGYGGARLVQALARRWANGHAKTS